MAIPIRLHLPAAVAQRLAAYEFSLRRQRLVKAIGLALCFTVFWTISWAVVDRLWALPSLLRLFLLATEAVANAIIVIRPVFTFLSSHIDTMAVAEAIELRHPSLSERLQTVVSQCSQPRESHGSTAMLHRLIADVETQLGHTTNERALPGKSGQYWPWALAVSLFSFGLMFGSNEWTQGRVLVARLWFPFSNLPPVSTIRLSLQPLPAEIVEGSSMTVVATVEKSGGEDVILRVGRNGADVISNKMLRASDGSYFHVVPSGDRDLKLSVACGDVQTSLQSVRVLPLPSVKRVATRCAFPDYIRRSPTKSDVVGGAIEAPAGSRCTILIDVSNGVKSVEIEETIGSEKRRIPATRSTRPDAWTANFNVDGDGEYSIIVFSEHGISRIDGKYSIRTIKDTSPTAAWLIAGTGLRVSPSGTISLPLMVEDDDGFTAIVAMAKVESGTALPIPIASYEANELSVMGSVAVDASRLGAKIGEVISVDFTATDTSGKIGQSKTINLLVAPSTTDTSEWRRTAALRRLTNASESAAHSLSAATTVLEGPSPDAERLTTVVAARLTESASTTGESAVALLDAATQCPRADAEPLAALVYDSQSLATALAGFNESLVSVSWNQARDFVRISLPMANQLNHEAVELCDRQTAIEALATFDAVRAVRDARAGRQPNKLADGVFDEAIAATTLSLTESLRRLNVAPDAADLAATLRDRIATATARLLASNRLNLSAAVALWSTRGGPDADSLGVRLGVASQIEARRSGGDLELSRDLLIAAAASRGIDAKIPNESFFPSRDQCAWAIAEVVALYEARLQCHESDATPISQRMGIARATLRRLAGDTPIDLSPTSRPGSFCWPAEVLLPSESDDVEMPAPPPMRVNRSASSLPRPDDPARRDALDLYFRAIRLKK